MRLSRLMLSSLCSIQLLLPAEAAPATTNSSPPPVAFQMAVYLSEAPKSAIADQVKKLRDEHFQDIELVDKLVRDTKGPEMSAVSVAAQKYPPPKETSLKYFGRGLSPEQARQVAASKVAWIITFAAPREQVLKLNELASRFMYAVATETGGFIWDEETREVFSPAEWKRRRIDSWDNGIPDVSQHITIHAYSPDDGPLVREITLGMVKFACPDVVANRVPHQFDGNMSSLIAVLCQTMVERDVPYVRTHALDLKDLHHAGFAKRMRDSCLAGASGRVQIGLEPATAEQGDPHNFLIQFVFSPKAGQAEQEVQLAMISQMFGSHDQVSPIKADDPDVLAASRLAKSKLPEKKALFAKGFPALEHLLVKAPFKTTGANSEYMWVEVTGWSGETITGILTSDPMDVPDLKPGAKVTVNENDVYDYIHYHADGTEEGNETTKVIERKYGSTTRPTHGKRIK